MGRDWVTFCRKAVVADVLVATLGDEPGVVKNIVAAGDRLHTAGAVCRTPHCWASPSNPNVKQKNAMIKLIRRESGYNTKP